RNSVAPATARTAATVPATPARPSVARATARTAATASATGARTTPAPVTVRIAAMVPATPARAATTARATAPVAEAAAAVEAVEAVHRTNAGPTGVAAAGGMNSVPKLRTNSERTQQPRSVDQKGTNGPPSRWAVCLWWHALS